MRRFLICLLIFSLLAPVLNCPARNETAKWYFGSYAGLDFMTNPPTPLANSQMTMTECTACMSDAAGNLLFYTNGVTIQPV